MLLIPQLHVQETKNKTKQRKGMQANTCVCACVVTVCSPVLFLLHLFCVWVSFISLYVSFGCCSACFVASGVCVCLSLGLLNVQRNDAADLFQYFCLSLLVDIQ